MNSQPNKTEQNHGVLYVVATPIGNLGDISERMRHILANVDRIAAEDTRRTKQLLSHIDADTPCFSLHDHNERQKMDFIVQCLERGESIALVSDAGTPLISDPGYPLVHELRRLNHKVIAIPGPCALIAALSIAGLPTDRFLFEGFLPAKSNARQNKLLSLEQETATLVFYESSHRIYDCLVDVGKTYGMEREIVVARELTKTFETIIQGTVAEVLLIFDEDKNQSRGEFVLMIKGAQKQTSLLGDNTKQLALLLKTHLPGKQAAKIASEMYGDKKNLIYQFLLDHEE